MATTKTALITGANRGIGLALTQRFLRGGYDVYAAARNPDGARELWELERDYPGRVRALQIDVTSDAEVRAAARTLDEAGVALDVLVNNAGIFPSDAAFEDLSLDAVRKGFDVNVLGPMRVTQAFLPHLKKGKKKVVATLSSKMGSIADNTSGKAYAYRISKAAVNMFNKSLAKDHAELIAVVLHPGWVQTEMGGQNAPVKSEGSAEGLFQVIDLLKPADTGRFLDYRGQEIPW